MRARRIVTAQGIAYAYRDRDQCLRRLWVISENSPDEVYQELERIWRLIGYVDIYQRRIPVDCATRAATPLTGSAWPRSMPTSSVNGSNRFAK
jgi:hypothetical protein